MLWLEIGLEFVRWSFAECNNPSEGFSEPEKDAWVNRVGGGWQPHKFMNSNYSLLYITDVWCVMQYGLGLLVNTGGSNTKN